VVKPRLAFDRAIDLIRGAGGIAALAHPPYNLRIEALGRLVEAGLAAIEVDGPGISKRLGRRWLDWAGELALIPVAGSDFHSPARPGRGRYVGSITTPPDRLERLRQAAAAESAPLR
jgi:predicted metal-dependent phosphoesterase TrpH